MHNILCMTAQNIVLCEEDSNHSVPFTPVPFSFFLLFHQIYIKLEIW